MSISLDQVAADADALRELPREALGELLERAAIVTARLQFAASAPAADGGGDDALDVNAAAALIGISPLTLSHHSRTRYANLRINTGTRNLRFSRRAIEAWILAGSPTALAPSKERKPEAPGPGFPSWLAKGKRGRRA